MIWGVLVWIFALSAAGAWGLEYVIARERQLIGEPPQSISLRRQRPWLVLLLGLGAGLLVMVCHLRLGSLDVPEVQPSGWGRMARLYYHLVLCELLLLATVIDFDCYLIPDMITVPGFLIGILAAVCVGELQIAHLWVDWSLAVPQLSGPFIPEWYSQHPWAHALAWSWAGAACGALITQVVRWMSRGILGQEAMGFGDVMFMGMIGSFLGWQATLLVFGIAPLAGLAFAILGKLIANRSFLPYGPCLAAGTFVVLTSWSFFWRETRLIFSDLWTVLLLLAGALGGMALLLQGLRAYRQIPTTLNK